MAIQASKPLDTTLLEPLRLETVWGTRKYVFSLMSKGIVSVFVVFTFQRTLLKLRGSVHPQFRFLCGAALPLFFVLGKMQLSIKKHEL